MSTDADVPMSFAGACLVRMTEILSGPILLTTDADFRIYRRLGRRTIRACCRTDRVAFACARDITGTTAPLACLVCHKSPST